MLRNIFTKIPGISTFSEFTNSSQPCRMKTLRPFSPINDVHRRVTVRNCDKPRTFKRSSSVPSESNRNTEKACLVANPWQHQLDKRPRSRALSQNSTTNVDFASVSSQKFSKSNTRPSNDQDQNNSEKEYEEIEVVDQYELEASTPQKHQSQKGFNVFESMNYLENENCPDRHLQPNNLKPFGSCENQFFPSILRNKPKPVILYPETEEVDEPVVNKISTRSGIKDLRGTTDIDNMHRRSYSTIYKPAESLYLLKNKDKNKLVRYTPSYSISGIKSQDHIIIPKSDQKRIEKISEHNLGTLKREQNNDTAKLFELPANSYVSPISNVKSTKKEENILQNLKVTDKARNITGSINQKYDNVGSIKNKLPDMVVNMKTVLPKKFVNSDQNLLKKSMSSLSSTDLMTGNNKLKTTSAQFSTTRRPLEPSRCEKDPPKPKCFLPSKIRLKPPICITKPPPCPVEKPCVRADDCLTEDLKELPILEVNDCPCQEPEMPDKNPKLKRLQLKFVDPPRICPCAVPCPERADDNLVEKEKKLKPHIPTGCACVEPLPMIDIPLKRLVKSCQPEAKCYPKKLCPEPEPCIRADDCLEEKQKELPVLVASNCPCIEPKPLTNSPSLTRLNLKIEEPPRICPRPCVCCNPRADDNLQPKDKKLPIIYSGDCPCIERPIVDVPPLKRLECKEEEECLESDPCIDHPRADLGCWEYYVPEKKCKSKEDKRKLQYHGKRRYNTDCKTRLIEKNSKYEIVSKIEEKKIPKNLIQKESLLEHLKKSNETAPCKNLLNNLYNLENKKNELIVDEVPNNFSRCTSRKSFQPHGVRNFCTSINKSLGFAPTRYLSRSNKLENNKAKKGKSKKSERRKCKIPNDNECDKLTECRPKFILKECASQKCVKNMQEMCDKENVYVCCEKKKSPYPSFSEVLDERIPPFVSTSEWRCNRKGSGFHPTPDKRRIIDPNKPDQEAYSTLAGVQEKSSLLKGSENGAPLSSQVKRQMSSFSFVRTNFDKKYDFLSCTIPGKVSCRSNSRKKDSKKVKCPPYRLKTKEVKVPKYNLENCPPVVQRDPTCPKHQLPVPCQKLQAPFPAFTDCLDEELAENLSECPLERFKRESIQPLYYPKVQQKMLEPVEPQVGKLDPKIEEACIRCKLNLKNEGVTQGCSDFGKYIKPMKSRDYIKDKKKQECCNDFNQKRHYSSFKLSNGLFDVQKMNISLNRNKLTTSRSYHALCQQTEKCLGVEKGDQLTDIPQYIATDGEDNKKPVKLRNVQWRIDNFKKWRRVNKLNNTDYFLKRYYSCSKTANEQQITMQLQRLLYTTSQLRKSKRYKRQIKSNGKENKHSKSTLNHLYSMREHLRTLQPQYPILPELETTYSSLYQNVNKIPSALELKRLRKKLRLISQDVKQNCATIDKHVQPNIEIIKTNKHRNYANIQKEYERHNDCEMNTEKNVDLKCATVNKLGEHKIQPELVVEINATDKTKNICYKDVMNDCNKIDPVNSTRDNIVCCAEGNEVCADQSSKISPSTSPKTFPEKHNNPVSKYTVIWKKVVNYFKARPDCPPPDEWKKKALREKAEKAAKAAGLCICDPKESVKVPKCDDLPKVILPPCKSPPCKSTKKDTDVSTSNNEQKRCFGTSCQTINCLNANSANPRIPSGKISFVSSQHDNADSVQKIHLLRNFQPFNIMGLPKTYFNKNTPVRGTLYFPMYNNLRLPQNMNMELVSKRFYSKNSNLKNNSKQLEDDKKKKVTNTFLEDSGINYNDKDAEEIETKPDQNYCSFNANRRFLEINDDLVLAYKLQLCKGENGDPFGLNQVKLVQDHFHKDEFLPDMCYEELEQLKTKVMVKHLDTVLKKLEKQTKLKC